VLREVSSSFSSSCVFFFVLFVFSSCVSFDGIGRVCDERLIFSFWRLFLQILISLRSNSSRRIAAYLLFCSPSLDSEVLVVLTRAAEGKTADVLRQEFLFVNRQFPPVTDDLYA
jgi:hypothetical protein